MSHYGEVKDLMYQIRKYGALRREEGRSDALGVSPAPIYNRNEDMPRYRARKEASELIDKIENDLEYLKENN
jgi:hypothetical protein